jgi:hypothetical protein
MTSVLARMWLTEDDRRLGDLEAVLSPPAPPAPPALLTLLARGADERERESAADEARPA